MAAPLATDTCGHRIGVLLVSYAMAKGQAGRGAKLELLQGTLDLIVLQTLDTMGPQHGFGIAPGGADRSLSPVAIAGRL